MGVIKLEAARIRQGCQCRLCQRQCGAGDDQTSGVSRTGDVREASA